MVPNKKLCLAISTLLLALGLLVACNSTSSNTFTNGVPKAPSNLTVEPKKGKISLSWQDNSENETGFVIYRQVFASQNALTSLAGNGYAELETVVENVTQYDDASIELGVSYRYAVSATNGNGTSELAATDSDEPVAVVNTAPVADDLTVSTNKDTSVALTLTGSDEEASALTFSVVTEPEHGTLSGGTPNLSYSPNANFIGTDSFTFLVNDGIKSSETATVTIRVGAAFTSVPVTEIDQGEVYSYEVTANLLGSGVPDFAASSDLPAWLTLTDNGDGSAVLSGAATSSDLGDHDVTLRATDSAGGSAEQLFTVTVSVAQSGLVVLSNLESGRGSLRQTLLDAPADATVTFADTLKGQTITLMSGQLVLNKNVTIDGDATVDASASSRIFYVNPGVTAVLNNLKLRNGRVQFEDGGGVYNRGTLTLTGDSSISGNTGKSGGGVYNEGTLTLQNTSSISNNSGDPGAGVYNKGTLILQDYSSVSGNNEASRGAGVANAVAGVFILQDNSSVSNNISFLEGAGVSNSGTLTMKDNASISSNFADFSGGGVSNYGTLTLENNASISNNGADEAGGGGVFNSKNGTVTLEGSSSLTNNSAFNGGGIYSSGSLILKGMATISGNEARSEGGGVYNQSRGTLIGVDHDGENDDDNVFGNSPDQVYRVQE